MVEEAVRKIEEEIKRENNPYVKVIGEFLIKQLDVNPGVAEKILNKDKSILSSLGEMKKVAEKKKSGNCAILTDEEGFAIVLKYFGIESQVIKEVKREASKVVDIKEYKKTEEIDFEINLDEYLK